MIKRYDHLLDLLRVRVSPNPNLLLQRVQLTATLTAFADPVRVVGPLSYSLKLVFVPLKRTYPDSILKEVSLEQSGRLVERVCVESAFSWITAAVAEF